MSEDIKVTDGTVLESLNNKADRDLLNLTEEGEKHFLNKSQITNCLLEVPQRINLELTDSGLTLKAGSVVIVPNGADGYKEVTVASDMTMTLTAFTGSEQFMLFYNDTDTGAFAGRRLASQVGSGTATPTSGHWNFYNTNDNLVYVVASSELRDYRSSLPLGLITVTDGTITSIDQVFNGIGYIGSTVWVDKGVKGLIPDGRNADGSLKNIEWTNSSFSVLTHGTSDSSGAIQAVRIGQDGMGWYRTHTTYWQEEEPVAMSGLQRWYKPSDNIWRERNASNAWYNVQPVLLSEYTVTKGVISDFNPKETFMAVDYNGKAEISAWSMPSSRYINLTLGASGTTYTAPANGWFYLVKTSSAANQYLNLYNKTACWLGMGCNSSASGQQIRVYVPVKKGDGAYVSYTMGGSNTTYDGFSFIYAEGAK
ncbi:MAG: hypothetical protein IKU15_07335 [Clostridia bacterium]|nr:hypothetical protein [Clostridia bacterium]